jgi:hypothetical protein
MSEYGEILKRARAAILGLFREVQSQEVAEFADSVIGEIDKILEQEGKA